MTNNTPILELRGLEKHFEQETSLLEMILRKRKEPIQAVDGVSMELRRNESKAVIGESGCGKTTLLLTLMGLHEHTGGEFLFKGEPVSTFDKAGWKEFRRNVQIIFQDPFNSLDPKKTVRSTLKQPLNVHGFEDQEERILDVLEQVELNPPEKFIDRFPEQLSGGERQRVSIARALILEPEVILADEPVSMLDVSTQAAILETLENLIEDLGMSMIYISHDLSTVSYVAEEINVMYLGRIVESAPTKQLIDDPKHPYSEALISAIPIPDPTYERTRPEVHGAPQDPVGMGDGCRFRDRCPERMDVCEKTPAFLETDPDHEVACHLHYDHEEYVARREGDTETDQQSIPQGEPRQ